MFINDRPTTTLTEMRDRLDQNVETIEAQLKDIRVDLTEDIRVTIKGREVPVSEMTLDVIGGALQMPAAFRRRMPTSLTEHVMNTLLERSGSMDMLVRMNDEWVFSIQERGARVIDPGKIVDIAAKVLTPSALVDRWSSSSSFFGFDVIVPESFDRGIGGDPKKGDITCGGLRFGLNRKQNLAPEVSSLLYRPICTNGMTMGSEHFKVDARGSSVDEILVNLERMAEAAFSEIESQIEHFYGLRDQEVTHPERMISRLSREHKLSERLRLRLIDAVPQIETTGSNGETTMFDIVNLATNLANDPELPNGAAAKLQHFGGELTHVHGARCRTCNGSLN